MNLAADLQAQRKQDIDTVVATAVADIVWSYTHVDGRPDAAMDRIMGVFENYKEVYYL